MSRLWQSPRKNSLCHHCHFHCHCHCRCHWRCLSPPGTKIIDIFVFLSDITLLVVISPFHVYLFVLIYLFDVIFPPYPIATKASAAEYQQIHTSIPIPISTPLIQLLDDDGLISPYYIICNPLCILRGQNLPLHEILTTFLPAYPIWRHRLWLQLRWVQKWFPRVRYFPVLHLLSPPGVSLRKKLWNSWGRGFPLLPKPPTLKKIRIMTKTTEVVVGGTGTVVSIIGRGEDDPPSPILSRWIALPCIISREGPTPPPPVPTVHARETPRKTNQQALGYWIFHPQFLS